MLANSAEPDEMQHYAAFHLGLYCLPRGVSTIQRVKHCYFFLKHGYQDGRQNGLCLFINTSHVVTIAKSFDT